MHVTRCNEKYKIGTICQYFVITNFCFREYTSSVTLSLFEYGLLFLFLFHYCDQNDTIVNTILHVHTVRNDTENWKT